MRIPMLALGACTLALAGCVVPPPHHRGPSGYGPGYGGPGVSPYTGHATPYQHGAAEIAPRPRPGAHERPYAPAPYQWGR